MKCHHIGCEAHATHALKVMVPSSAVGNPLAAEGMLGVEMCEEHFDMAELREDFLLHPVVQMLFQAVVEPGTDPDWGRAYLEAVEIGSLEYKCFKSLELVH